MCNLSTITKHGSFHEKVLIAPKFILKNINLPSPEVIGIEHYFLQRSG